MEERTIFKVSVQGLLFNNNSKIVLLKRTNTSYCNNMYTLPGGHLEIGETIIDGIKRELYEEIGVMFSNNELSLIKIINRKVNNENYIDFIFKGELKERQVINKEKNKCSEIIYRNIKNIPENSIPILKRIVKNDIFYDVMDE